MNFPGNAKCVVLLTFDFDAELMWNSYPRTPGYAQRGQYGANVGVPHILSLLESHQFHTESGTFRLTSRSESGGLLWMQVAQ